MSNVGRQIHYPLLFLKARLMFIVRRQLPALIAISSVLLIACSTTIKTAAPDQLPGQSDTSCSFTVTDLRPNPLLLVAQMSNRSKAIDIAPSLALSVGGRVCKALSPAAKQATGRFVITGYDCVVSGFFTSTYLVEIRGKLAVTGSPERELRQSEAYSDNSGFIPRGCEAATALVLDRLVPSIVAPLESRSASRTGTST